MGAFSDARQALTTAASQEPTTSRPLRALLRACRRLVRRNLPLLGQDEGRDAMHAFYRWIVLVRRRLCGWRWPCRSPSSCASCGAAAAASGRRSGCKAEPTELSCGSGCGAVFGAVVLCCDELRCARTSETYVAT